MAKFSKGHYIILANALLRAKITLLNEQDETHSDAMAYKGLTYAMNEIATALGLDNPKFDRDRFFEWVREGDSWRGHEG